MQSQLFRYRNLVRELVVRDIKIKYRRSVLGILWSLLNPLGMMVITAMVFSTVFRFHIDNYVVYLLTGQMFLSFYGEATNFAMTSIVSNASLIRKIYVPRQLFPLSRVLSSSVNFILTFPALLAIMLFTGATISPTIFACVVPVFLLLCFTLGMGFFLAAAAVYFRDLFLCYRVVLTALTYATPIFYPESIVPDKFRFLLDYNPMYYYLKAFREVICHNALPPLSLLSTCAIISAVTLVAGGLFFHRAQNKFILYI